MKQVSHPSQGKSPSSQHNSASTASKQPKPAHFGLIYTCYKYGTIIILACFIAFAGINILGDTSIEVEGNRRIFEIYEKSENFKSQVDRINTLFQKQSSKYVSNNIVNLYSNDINPAQGQQLQNSHDQFDDLINFSDFVINQRYHGKNILYLPLNLNDNNSQFLQQSYSSRILNYMKKTVDKLMKKYKISHPGSVKQLKWSRVKKLLENGKIDELVQLISDNIKSGIWGWVRSFPSVIVLTASQQQLTQQLSPKVKKSLKKWIRQNDQQSQIIILTKYSINKLYDTKDDIFKSFHVQNISLSNVNNNILCAYLSESLNMNSSEKCLLLKSKFETLKQLVQFVDDYEPVINSGQKYLQQCEKLLNDVCENGHVKHYFYQNQQNANKVVGTTKSTSKGKKSRSDKEWQSLIVMWSQLKKSIGLNRIQDIVLTLTSERNYEEGKSTMSLRDMNEKGLVYDFELHELIWRGQKERLIYEIRNDKVCKNGKVVVEEMDKQVRENKKQQQFEEKKAKQQQEKTEQQQQQVKAQQQEVKKVEQQPTIKEQQTDVDNQQQQGTEQQQQSKAENQQQKKLVDEQAEQQVEKEQQQEVEQGQILIKEEQQQHSNEGEQQQQIGEQQQQQQPSGNEQKQQVIKDDDDDEVKQEQAKEQQVVLGQQQQPVVVSDGKSSQPVNEDTQQEFDDHQAQEHSKQIQSDDKSFIQEIDINQINLNQQFNSNDDEQQVKQEINEKEDENRNTDEDHQQENGGDEFQLEAVLPIPQQLHEQIQQVQSE